MISRNPKDLKENAYSRNIFPPLEGKIYDFLKEDIREHGIRTPVEITNDNLIICGHERVRIALELGLTEIPVVIFEKEEKQQKIRVITDNLLRKAVDFETKFKCFTELKKLYGLEHGESGKLQAQKGKKDFLAKTSTDVYAKKDIPIMTEEEIAKEVGIGEMTFWRAQKIQESNIDEKIKKAVFEGNLPIRPISDLIDKPLEIQIKTVKKILNELKNENSNKINVSPIVRETEKEEEDRLMAENIAKAEAFVKRVNERQRHQKQNISSKEKERKKMAENFVHKWLNERLLCCPKCEKSELEWSCCHAKF